MIGSLILLMGKTTNGQKGHPQSDSLAEAPPKDLGETLIII